MASKSARKPSSKPKKANTPSSKKSTARLWSAPKLSKLQIGLVAGGLAIVGIIIVWAVFAATGSSTEPEAWSVDKPSGTQVVSDASASSGQYLEFLPAPPPSSYGAQLPINYSLSSLSGSQRFVATNGNDSSGNGSVNAPYATIAKAYSVATAGDSIVIRGGLYRQGNVELGSKQVKITAYPGEIPEFNGAQIANDGWTPEGSYQYRTYTQRAVTTGNGIDFASGRNLTGSGVGKYADQAWVGNTQLQQVNTKAELADGKFWVDGGASRMYVTTNDKNKGNLEITQRNRFMHVYAAGTTIEGLRVKRFSNNGGDYGVFLFEANSNNTIVQNVEIIDPAYMAIMYGNSSNQLTKNVTIDGANWMGINGNYTTNLTLDSIKVTNLNRWGEFATSPQSGAYKGSRNWYTKITNSQFTNNNSHVLWMDQSNYDTVIANNTLTGNSGSSIFFEISDKLLLINNYISSPSNGQPVKTAGSSGLRLVNNTLIGGADPISIYTDSRSAPGCADYTARNNVVCPGGDSSDWDKQRTRPATMDWMPRLDLMINNIAIYPTRSYVCGIVPVCITHSHSSNTLAQAPIQTIIHKSDSSRGIPQTFMDGNLYANDLGSTMVRGNNTNFTTASAWSTFLIGSPVGIGGLEANSKSGSNLVNTDGSLKAGLTDAQAVAIPTDTQINQYISSGTKRFGSNVK